MTNYVPLFINQNRDLNANSTPYISTKLDSVRAYQWEIQFTGLNGASNPDRVLTVAAKSVSQTGYAVEDIEVHRLNDKVFYPGKASTEDLTVIFDNLYVQKMSSLLYNWIRNTYDPVTGILERNGANGMKLNAHIIQLGNNGQPISNTKLIGMYPKSWKQAEFNYATNEFHTLEVMFRYDFIVQNDNGILSA